VFGSRLQRIKQPEPWGHTTRAALLGARNVAARDQCTPIPGRR
jgi:hypothetical protein